MKCRIAHPTSLVLKLIADSLAISLAFYLAFALRFDGEVPPAQAAAGWTAFLLLIPCRLGSQFLVTRYRMQWRFMSLSDGWIVLESVLIGSLAFWVALILLPLPLIPRGVFLLEALLTLQFLIMLRVGTRLAWNRRSGRPAAGTHQRVLVIGAGYSGSRVVRDMKEDRAVDLLPVGFLDDDPGKRDRLINGVPVLGSTFDVTKIVEKHRVDQILIAIPSLSASALSSIIHRCDGTRADLTILPGLPELLTARSATGQIRKVRVEDLLDRVPVRVDMEEIAAFITGERVLVTGAGGSIGSELCRQIASLNPEVMILLGQGENSIFWIEREIRSDFEMTAVPVIADIKDRRRLEEVFKEHRPTVVFHAAAHKHVPLMEQNPEEAIKNNVFGTHNLAVLAIEHSVKRFVMISTDKAVNPTSVMGASKRVAEMLVQSLAQRIRALREGDAEGACLHLNHVHLERAVTRFAAVRFGNVLGSRGSVIPSMQQQIARGGPVTVTHPDMVRFFMTIPEAVQLVIQAGAMARDGEVFVLDMGNPIRILDLARNLIRLSGFTPERDIAIQITGIRPGEKLFEEVLTAEEGTTATANSKIFTARPSRIDHEYLARGLENLGDAVARGDRAGIRRLLREIVPTFQVSPATRPAPHPAAQESAALSGNSNLADSARR